MFDLKDLYQEVIVDHNRSPRNFHKMDDANRTAEGFNPLCGDRLTLYMRINDQGVIEDVSFEGSGCAISTASASLMTEHLKGKTEAEAQTMFDSFHDMVVSDVDVPVDSATMGKLSVLAGVREFPSRVKCASLCWHTMTAALANTCEMVKTE